MRENTIAVPDLRRPLGAVREARSSDDLVTSEGSKVNGHYVTSMDDLRELYPEPSEMVVRKEMDHLDKNCRAFIAASPFVLLATSGSEGVDCSPRGDGAGFVRVADEGTLMVPDRAGNNRLDSLRNIVENPRIGLLFLIPGITHTLRVNGTARLSVAPDLLESFAVKGKAPRSVAVVSVEKAFVQCSRALLRAGLWNPENLAKKTPCRASDVCSPTTRRARSRRRSSTTTTGQCFRRTCIDRSISAIIGGRTSRGVAAAPDRLAPPRGRGGLFGSEGRSNHRRIDQVNRFETGLPQTSGFRGTLAGTRTQPSLKPDGSRLTRPV